MTPFQVYLLMKADDVSFTMGLIAIFASIAFFITTVGRGATKSEITQTDIENQSSDWRNWQMFVYLQRWATALFFTSLTLWLVVPDTKAIATMFVVPKLTSPAALNELGADGKELYGIAKGALQRIADKAAPAPASSSK